jgi:CRP/FNR family transcriptional regulator, dissimilatory nitrate respiration regulator
MTLEEKLLALQVTTAFRGLTIETLIRLLERSSYQVYQRGELFFEEGDEVSQVFILVSGEARTFYLTKQTREFTVGVYQPRAVLGLQSVFQTKPSYSVSAQMLKTGLVLCLDAVQLEQMVLQDAVFANALLRFVVSRSGALLRRIDEVFFADLNARVARVLLEHSDPNGWLLPANLVLAAELGTVPELISRKLGEFYRLGLIQITKRRVWILDKTTLSHLLETTP